jgi:acyl phosphate:glycerol-3-phosphate acyltransferase
VAGLRSLIAVGTGFCAGAIPFSNIVARRRAGVDLRDVGSGTVSGSGLYAVTGAGPLIAVGLLELAKGALGPALAGRGHPGAAALAGGAAVVGHNWSPFLAGAGGRGISPAMGALLVTAPAGSAVLLAGLAFGKLVGETAIGSFVADIALLPVAARAHGRQGLMAASAVLAPIVVKRLAGNGPPARPGAGAFVNRLLLDRDTRGKAGGTRDKAAAPTAGGPAR